MCCFLKVGDIQKWLTKTVAIFNFSLIFLVSSFSFPFFLFPFSFPVFFPSPSSSLSPSVALRFMTASRTQALALSGDARALSDGWKLVVAGHSYGSGSNDFFSASVGRRLCLLLSLDLDSMSCAHQPDFRQYSCHKITPLPLPEIEATCSAIQCQLVTLVFHSQSSQSLWFPTQFSSTCFTWFKKWAVASYPYCLAISGSI